MNLSLYTAIERIGLGLAVTLEFLGPLLVAIASSRKPIDFACAAGAAVGVVVLTAPGPATDVLGIGLALSAAAAWAAYILLNRTIGQSLPGIQGTAIAAIVAGSVWTPIGILWFVSHEPTISSMLLAVLCGLLSSIVPYVADLNALRRVPAQLFGTVTSINPVWAVLVGWLILGEILRLHEAIGLALIILSNVVVSARTIATSRRRPGGDRGSRSGRLRPHSVIDGRRR
jgi:inner membrane transporter RhtA